MFRNVSIAFASFRPHSEPCAHSVSLPPQRCHYLTSPRPSWPFSEWGSLCPPLTLPVERSLSIHSLSGGSPLRLYLAWYSVLCTLYSVLWPF